MKNTLVGQNLPLSPMATQSQMVLHRTRPAEDAHARLGHHHHHHHHQHHPHHHHAGVTTTVGPHHHGHPQQQQQQQQHHHHQQQQQHPHQLPQHGKASGSAAAAAAAASAAAAQSAKGRAFNYTMHDCYERLKELVPTIPKNKKITRVEILQHVIDYIQDLQSALEAHNISVGRGQGSSTGSGPARAPFTSLTPQQNLDVLSGLADLENCDWQRTLLNLTTASRGSKLHPYETPDSSPETPSTCSSC